MGRHEAGQATPERSVYLRATYWVGVTERAVKTAAQTMLAGFTLGQAVTAVDWQGVLAITGTATLYSVLTSLATPEAADVAQTTTDGIA